MDSNNMQNKPVKPNVQPGQKPVRPNVQPGQRPVRPNIQNGQRPVRPNVQQVQRPVQPQVRPQNTQVTNNAQQNIGDDFSFNNQIQTEPNQEQFIQNTVQMNPVQQAQQMQQEQMQMQNGATVKVGKQPKAKKEKVPKQPKAPKQPKVKKEKAPKQPKVPKVPKQPKLDEFGNPIPENKLKKYGILAGCIVGGLLIVVIILKVLSSGSDQHITLADVEPAGGQEQVSTVVAANTEEDEGLNQSMSDIKQEIAQEAEENAYNTSSPVVGTSTDVKIAVGSIITIPITVTTQLQGDKEDTDYYSYITVKYDGMTFGYDEVKEAIDAHNADTKHVVNIDNKDEFFKKNAGCDLVMYSFTFDIPSNFPTQDTSKHKVYISPSFGMELEGSEDPEKLITERYTFSVPNISPMTDDISLLHAGDSFKLNWIAVMPTGLDKSGYKLAFKYKIGEDNGTYTVESVTIPDNGRSDEIGDTATQQPDSTTVDTGETAQDTDKPETTVETPETTVETPTESESTEDNKPEDSGIIE